MLKISNYLFSLIALNQLRTPKSAAGRNLQFLWRLLQFNNYLKLQFVIKLAIYLQLTSLLRRPGIRLRMRRIGSRVIQESGGHGGNLHFWDSTPRSSHMFPLSEQPAVLAPFPKLSQPCLPDKSQVLLPSRLSGWYVTIRLWKEKKAD